MQATISGFLTIVFIKFCIENLPFLMYMAKIDMQSIFTKGIANAILWLRLLNRLCHISQT